MPWRSDRRIEHEHIHKAMTKGGQNNADAAHTYVDRRAICACPGGAVAAPPRPSIIML